MRELEEKLGRVPTNDEISRLMDLPVETVQKLKTISREPVSLEAPVGRDGESALGELIEDRWVGSPVDSVIDSNIRDEMANILKMLSPKQEKVIRLRFGIGCAREHTLGEIGQEFDLTRERIRQIEAKALRQLRSPERARHLQALLAARFTDRARRSGRIPPASGHSDSPPPRPRAAPLRRITLPFRCTLVSCTTCTGRLLSTTSLPPRPTALLPSTMKRATTRRETGTPSEPWSTRIEPTNSQKRLTTNRDGLRAFRNRSTMRDSHRKAAELHDLAAHAHRVAAEHHEKQDHLTGHEHSRHALEHSHRAHQMSSQAHEEPTAKHPANAPADDATK